MAHYSLVAVAVFATIFAALTIAEGQRTTSSPFEGIFEDVASCKGDCEGTYPLHTYPEPVDLKACYRGCRLFSMMDFVEVAFDEDFNATIKECRNACGEAYTDPNQLMGCEMGCTYQVPYARALHGEWAAEESNIHLLVPMFSVQSLWRGILDTYNGLSYSYWSVYMQDEQGKMYVFESRPQVDVFTLHPDANRVSARNWMNAETNLQVSRLQTPTGYYNGKLPYEKSSWLDCISSKSGLPRWLLSMTLFLSVLALIWLCFMTFATAPEQRVSTPKLSIYGDLDYLKKGTMSPYPVYIQNVANKKGALPPRDDDDDVEPLPLKVDISTVQSLI